MLDDGVDDGIDGDGIDGDGIVGDGIVVDGIVVDGVDDVNDDINREAMTG